MRNRQSLFLVPGRPDEFDEREPLAVGAGVYQSFVRSYRRSINRTGRADRHTEIRASQFLADTFKGKEEEGFVFADRTANRSSKLFPIEICQRLTVRCVGGQG